ncbi:OLC1v1029966C1 [Oldenlandia corymbosa var. corymbosa]|uniref:OLC1v1029966C1 n=1 Tax=Oldenlandia corymbosa var. corymbosa TaxID=529605 RepID=A0AAV1CFR8_OLDCO|nr:OLC1v1029966C1 [Oldenlandia corymbosa var. corymbosa]
MNSKASSLISTQSARVMAPSKISNGSHHQGSQIPMIPMPSVSSNGGNGSSTTTFQMPLHYPRFKKADYEKMPESQLDCLLREYGLLTTSIGDLDQKRKFAVGAFLWPDEY